MRIGFMLPGDACVGNPGNGVVEQARCQATALESRGHTVVRMNPWHFEADSDFDVLQFFMGGPALSGVHKGRRLSKPGILVFAPTIDSNMPNLLYRAAAAAGSVIPQVQTIPGWYRQQASASDVVVCRSIHEQERVVLGLGIERGKTDVVLNGIAVHDLSPVVIAERTEQLDLPEKFVLHLSAYTQERKNVLRMLEAIQPLGYPIVIAGSATPGATWDALRRMVSRNQNIRLLGFVDKETRNALYKRCRVFCLPSIHEGTGLAALEAAALGARIVITRRGGASDYFRDYAEYVDPYDVRSITAAVEKAWTKESSAALQQHILQNLSWESSAARLEEVYRNRLKTVNGRS